jgi:hypothetical protein
LRAGPLARVYEQVRDGVGSLHLHDGHDRLLVMGPGLAQLPVEILGGFGGRERAHDAWHLFLQLSRMEERDYPQVLVAHGKNGTATDLLTGVRG